MTRSGIFVIDESQLTFNDVRDDFISKMSTVTRSQVFERYFNTKPFIASVQGQTSQVAIKNGRDIETPYILSFSDLSVLNVVRTAIHIDPGGKYKYS